uniref:Uncharacterized protein n=1 Tax=Alexandrium catenella TaxID=2925 RepID=A0A7S1RHZ4_ALECA|mmetsp:Transcript_59556/g.159584  ORF Transcript_59556/g.159584 Transcript_59556/m.159584 type:complete len:117 (+) Transcript_59556:45-395(+)
MEENSGLASFLRGVAAERRTQGRQSNNPASYLEFAPPPQAKLQDWKLDDGRVSYVKDGIRFVTSRDGEGPDHEIKAGRRQPRKLDFVYHGFRHNNVANGGYHEWGGMRRSEMVGHY